ncbi:MAG: GNAT family N-acetyltransferase [Planctomycetota bacterium]|nr:MAG: GNAT family N-acetyltransferase [Planctomycetota bacterium]
MDILVRATTLADRDLLVGFNQAMAQESEGRALDGAILRRGVAAVLADAARGRYLVAEREGLPLGCLMITREWSDWRDAWIWWIQSVWVQPEARRQGVYRALHLEVQARAARAGDVHTLRLYVERENSAAQRTYASVGMSPSRYLLYAQALVPGTDD